MARAVLVDPFATRFFAGRGEIAVDAATVFALVRALDARAPGFAEAAELDAAVAVDGVVVADWGTALTAESEVLFVPKVAGGQLPD